MRHYLHLGTGNYNPNTAKLYTDLGLLTADADIAEDVTQLTYALAAAYQQAYAPFGCTELVLVPSDPHQCKWPEQVRS